MSLKKDRCDFTELLCTKLVPFIIVNGYEVCLDEVTEHLTKKDPTSDHIEGSKHHDGLAADLNLYKDGIWLSKTEDHRIFGEYWESLDPRCSWGGHFNDGNHYSFYENKII